MREGCQVWKVVQLGQLQAGPENCVACYSQGLWGQAAVVHGSSHKAEGMLPESRLSVGHWSPNVTLVA